MQSASQIFNSPTLRLSQIHDYHPLSANDAEAKGFIIFVCTGQYLPCYYSKLVRSAPKLCFAICSFITSITIYDKEIHY